MKKGNKKRERANKALGLVDGPVEKDIIGDREGKDILNLPPPPEVPLKLCFYAVV